MQRTERENGNAPLPIDIPSAVRGTLSKDEESTQQLDEALRQKLIPYFTRRDPNQAEDLTQDTLIKISTALPTFNPNLGEGNYEQNFWGWVLTIGRNAMIDHQRQELRQQGGIINIPINEDTQYPDAKEDGEDGRESYQIDDQVILNLIKSRFPDLLTGAEQDIIELRVAGRKNKEIAKLLNSTEGSVRVRMTRARAKIENEILEKIGFKPIDAFGNKKLQQAVWKGYMTKSIKIFGLFYVRDEDARNYKGRKIDQNLLDNGYVLLSQAATLSEYFHFLHEDLPLRHAGRLYIKTDDLEEFRKKGKGRRRKRLFPPSPDHKKLAHLCQTIAQYDRAKRAIKTDRLSAIKSRHGLFVKEEDFSAWAETLGE